MGHIGPEPPIAVGIAKVINQLGDLALGVFLAGDVLECDFSASVASTCAVPSRNVLMSLRPPRPPATLRYMRRQNHQ